jgi:lipoate-protein ligase A
MNPPLQVLDTGAGEPAWNMALDEALLETAAARGRPLLRCYGWAAPAATFGHFQRHAEIAAATPLRPLLRRPTGGGLVPHDADWTYSLSVPPGHAWHALAAEASYRTMHAWIVAALAALGVAAELADCCRREVPGQCFRGHEKFDVLRGGRKLAGAAQRRNRLGLLIQGSLQPPPPDVGRAAWQAAMIAARPAAFFGAVEAVEPGRELLSMAERLLAGKYRPPEHHERR